jgi:hypothetical protein
MQHADCKYGAKHGKLRFGETEAAQPQDENDEIGAALATFAANGPRSLEIENDDVVLQYVKAIRSNDRNANGQLQQYASRVTKPDQQAPRNQVDGAAPDYPNVAAMSEKLRTFENPNDREDEFAACYAMRNADDIVEGNDDVHLKNFNPSDKAISDAAAAARHNENNLFLEVAILEEQLNVGRQRDVYNKIKAMLKERVQDKVMNGKGHLMHVQGGPGTGKSFLINVLAKWAQMCSGNRALIMAYTGYAASHIGGLTTHRGLRLFQRFDMMDSETRESLSSRIKQAPFLLIDEVSMIGCEFFAKIIHRIEDALQDPFDAASPKFGKPGFPHIILVGDFGQLNPVGDTAFYWTFCQTPKRSENKPGSKIQTARAATTTTTKSATTKTEEEQKATRNSQCATFGVV